jgi:penicillin amidase
VQRLVVDGVGGEVTIARDEHGSAHVFADLEADCYFGLGLCMAQDRPRQLDWLRLRASGRLAERFGRSYRQLDIEARTLGFRNVAHAVVESLDPRTAEVLWAFADGLSAGLAEFGARTAEGVVEPWTPVDTVAVLRAFGWQLSGRLHHILAAELAQRRLTAERAKRFLSAYDGRSSIRKPSFGGAGPEEVGPGSNNWAIGNTASASGYPLLASDPHLPPAVPGLFFEATLEWGSTRVGGLCHAGIPGFVIGRNAAIAWGITNNLCSTRDLYLDDTSSARPASVRSEVIDVLDEEPISLDVCATRSGTVVNHLLEEPFSSGPPISLRWTGLRPSDELGSLLEMQTAQTTRQFRDALHGWACPTWNFVVCDVQGGLAYQCAGSIPLRGRRHAGVRGAINPEDVWLRLVPTAELPGFEPAEDRLVTANNRIDQADHVTEQNGFWVSSARADRIHHGLAAGARSVEDFAEMQLDVMSIAAAPAAARVVEMMGGPDDGLVSRCVIALAGWDAAYRADSVGATVFEAFWRSWVTAVVAQHFTPEEEGLMTPRAEPFAYSLLMDDGGDWFQASSVPDVVRTSFSTAVETMAAELGDDVDSWEWRRVHVWPALVGADSSFPGCGVGLPGGRNTVNNSHYDLRGSFAPTVLAANRVIADLAPGGGLLVASCTGNQEDPATGGACFAEWLRGDYHDLWLSKAQLEQASSTGSAGQVSISEES